MTQREEKKENSQPIALAKKVYTPPTLSEYGSVAKLTRSGGVTVSDHGGNRMGLAAR